MRITKFVHSCLLVETDAETVLFDPGSYSTVNPADLKRLDAIFITHEHQDHMYIPLIQQLQAKFPNVIVLAPASAAKQLQQAGIENVSSEPPSTVRLFNAPHEAIMPLFMANPPEEIGVHYQTQLTHPGDSHHFNESMPILALPMQAPWGSAVMAAKLALELKPKYVIPIHDWHWREEARQGMYDRFAQRFAETGIIFIKTVDGQPFEIN